MDSAASSPWVRDFLFLARWFERITSAKAGSAATLFFDFPNPFALLFAALQQGRGVDRHERPPSPFSLARWFHACQDWRQQWSDGGSNCGYVVRLISVVQSNVRAVTVGSLSLRGVAFFNPLGTSIRFKIFAFRLQCRDTYECTYV